MSLKPGWTSFDAGRDAAISRELHSIMVVIGSDAKQIVKQAVGKICRANGISEAVATAVPAFFYPEVRLAVNTSD